MSSSGPTRPLSIIVPIPEPGARAERTVPLRCPCGAACGRGRSRQCGGGSCAGGTATRTCRSGTGRPCCRHGRTAYPAVQNTVRTLVFSPKTSPSSRPVAEIPTPVLVWRHSTSGAVVMSLLDSGVGNSASVAIGGMGHPYLAGVDPLAGERIVVRSHFGGGCRVVVVGLLPQSPRSKVPGRFSPNSLVQVVG